MKIYSKGDIWDMSAMEQFVREVRSVDKNVTGNPVQIYEASLQMKRSYEQATWFALCTILPIMFLNLGNLRDTLLAVLPLGVCMLQMFGIMGFLDIPLNAANMISLPLMLGMGVDNGINIIYDYRRQQGKYPDESVYGRGCDSQHVNDHGRIRGVDDSRPSRIAEPGTRIDDRHELLPGLVADYFAGVFGLDYPKSPGRDRRDSGAGIHRADCIRTVR